MPSTEPNRPNIRRLKARLDFEAASAWLWEDARDDFFPDPLRLKDYARSSRPYLQRYTSRAFDLDPSNTRWQRVPKSPPLSRTALVLSPRARLIYLALLHRLIPLLSSAIHKSNFAYRPNPKSNTLQGQYPFNSHWTINNWKRFNNEFRKACLKPTAKYAIVTDLDNYYEHISISTMLTTLDSLSGGKLSTDYKDELDLLRCFLLHHASSGYGVPQNYDPSSFLCSVLLTPVDIRFAHKSVNYFRYVDDIRLVARSRRRLMDAADELHESLRDYGFFLSSRKTRIVERGTPQWEELIDVRHELILADADTAINQCSKVNIDAIMPVLREGIENLQDTDDRMFRAYCTKLMEIARFSEFRSAVGAELRSFVVARLRTHPGRIDYWVRVLSDIDAQEDASEDVLALLRDDEYNQDEWVRMWLWEYLIRGKHKPKYVTRFARAQFSRDQCPDVRARIALWLAKWMNAAELREFVLEKFKREESLAVRRALAIAAHRLPEVNRQYVWTQLEQRAPDISELVEYLRSNGDVAPTTWRPPKLREFAEVPTPPQRRRMDGRGVVNGEVVRFPLRYLLDWYD